MAVGQLLIVATLSWSCAAASFDWTSVENILNAQIANGSFPGCVALVADKSGVLFEKAFGSFTYGQPAPFSDGNPAVTNKTRWDMASLTKVLMTTTAVMTFYQRGEVGLDWLVASDQLLGPSFGVNGKEGIAVRNLLLHNAGFPADPSPAYSDSSFGCPATSRYFAPESFSCQVKIYEAVLNQTLINPVGEVFLYSDLSMITMMYVVGTLARNLGYVNVNELDDACLAASLDGDSTVQNAVSQCYFLGYVEKYVLEPTLMASSGFLQSRSDWAQSSPTVNDTVYRHHMMQGQVEDSNAYAMGGVSGHAGLFSTVSDTHFLLARLMFATEDNKWLNATTVNTFTTIYNVSQSSRALGWDTNNYLVRDYAGCGNFSQNTFMHTGYTGTQVCNDKDRQMYAILFTNRVYPDASAESETAITNARILFSDEVVRIYDEGQASAVSNID